MIWFGRLQSRIITNGRECQNVIANVPKERRRTTANGTNPISGGSRQSYAYYSCYAVSVVSRYNKNPGNSHWVAVKRIFRYLKGSIDRKLVFNGKCNGDIVGFCDADWAGDLDHRKSTTGYVFKMNDAAISWNSRKQQTVAISTTGAGYMSLAAAAQEAIWLRKLNHGIDGGSNRIIEIHCDNKSAIQLASTTMYHPRTKHIDVKYHFIR